MGALMRLVTQVRRFRSDQGLRPSQPVPAVLDGIEATPLAGHEASIRSLLRLAPPGGQLAATAAVLSNPSFVERAPEAVVARSRDRLTATQAEIARLEQRLAALPR